MKIKIFPVFFLITFFMSSGFAADYKRIISLAPSVTQSLYELGMDSEIAGITKYCPPGVSRKEIIGTLLEPDLEKIAELKPDLIISTKEGNSKAMVEKMIRMKFNVYVMETSRNFIEICANYYNLARKVDRKKEAAAIIDEAKDSVSDTEFSLQGAAVQTVFWEVGAKPLYTAGKLSFVNDYNHYTHTVNIYRDIDMRYPMIDIEDVIERNPEIIILVNMGDISNEEIANWKKYKTLNAVKNDKIFMIDVNDIFTPTPATFANGVKILAEKIHPEFFAGE